MDTQTTSNNNDSWVKYIPLHKAILRSDWDKANDIISNDADSLSAEIDVGCDTVIHVAVGVAVGTATSNSFFQKLLNKFEADSLPNLLCVFRHNALHHAAQSGNLYAAKQLVNKKPCLLFRCSNVHCSNDSNENKRLPIHLAVYNYQKDTFDYLLTACKQHVDDYSTQEGCHSPFQGSTGAHLLRNVILTELFDDALDLLKDYPEMARTMTEYGAPLEAIASISDAYYSGTRYNFYQRFLYTYVPVYENHLLDTQMTQDVENQDKTKLATNSNISRFYSVLQGIYDKVWEVGLLQVSQIKQLQKDKEKHNKALKILSRICQEIGNLKKGSEIESHCEQAFIAAVENDTPEVVEEILKHFPRTIWVTTKKADGVTEDDTNDDTKDDTEDDSEDDTEDDSGDDTEDDDYQVSQLAVINRSEKVFQFLVHKVTYNVHFLKSRKDGNNLLHLAGRMAPTHKLNEVSGAALQMQKELQWFEAVKNFINPIIWEEMNYDGKKPITIFREKHELLRTKGEDWMKKTADSCTIIAALIITIVFAAAITVPGGNDSETGKPVYETKASFIIFAVSDAISLFTSTTSLLLFLSVLTTRYRDEDFLYKLPKRLIFGLATLFMSVTSMMIAFSATLYIMFGQRKAWILIPIATLTCLPIASFVTLQLPLLRDLISSTYGTGILSKPNARRSK